MEASPAVSAPGDFVTQLFDFNGGRHVTVYVPRARPEAVVVAGDGQALAAWGADVAAGGPAVMVVGVHRLADETLRLHEYSPGFNPRLFAAHESFVLREVMEWVSARFAVALPAERTAALGISASGELALAMGLRHPEVFGTVLCASPGAGYQPPVPMPEQLPRAYLVAGTQEPIFLANATRWATAMAEAGADVVMEERTGSHGGTFWRREFPAMIEWAFGG